MSKRLYVGNLSFQTTEQELQDLFQEVGQVESCNLITDKVTGKSRGFGFVEMTSDEDAEKAIGEFDGKEVDGRTLKVNEARPRQDRDRAPRRNFDRRR
jgi:RNA recognition motif-containing protein